MSHPLPTGRAATAQRGAALVIGMVLLVILTLLAITGMNMASTELVMAGNEQYRQRADQAADLGVEQAISQLSTVPTTTGATVTVGPSAVAAGTPETWQSVSQYMGLGAVALPGSSVGKNSALVYRIVSTGTSSRNANTVIEQGALRASAVAAGGGANDTFP
jgi:hypothetical protein